MNGHRIAGAFDIYWIIKPISDQQDKYPGAKSTCDTVICAAQMTLSGRV